MRYMDYLNTWIAQKGFKGVHKIVSTADELDILKHYESVDWQDVTDFPDLPAQLVPAYDDSAAYILPAENMFKKARVYAPKVKSGSNLTENQALLQALPAAVPLVLQSRTNFSRWKKLKYIYVTFWANVLRTVKATYTSIVPGTPSFLVSRVEFNPALPPPQAPIVNPNPYMINAPNEINRTIIFQIDVNNVPPLNPNAIPFDDLVLLWDDMIDIPYYAEIEIWMQPQAGGGFIDVFLGMEVK